MMDTRDYEPRDGDPQFEYDKTTGGWTKPVPPDTGDEN